MRHRPEQRPMPELDLQRRRNLSRLAAGVAGSFGRHPQRCRPLCALCGATKG
jgi:hypothetical protein